MNQINQINNLRVAEYIYRSISDIFPLKRLDEGPFSTKKDKHHMNSYTAYEATVYDYMSI